MTAQKPRKLFRYQHTILRDPSQNKVGKAGRRGGKTVWLIAELGVTCIVEGLPCGWAGPNYPILRDAWRDINEEFGLWIVRAVNSETPWLIEFSNGARAEFWSLDQHVVARSRKYAKFIIDEAGVIPNLAGRYDAEIDPTLGDYNGKLVVGSTPNAVSPDFTKWYELGQQEGSGWRSWKWTSLDNPAVAENMALRIEAARARGVPEWIIQQEYFAEESEDETGFFTRAMIARCKKEHGREPVAVGSIDCGTEDIFEREAVVSGRKVSAIKWRDDPYGPWKFWQWWDGDRPPQDEIAFAVGIDLGWGVGASNTIFSVCNADTHEKIAEYANPNVTPEQAAIMVCLACYWLGGRTGVRVPLLNFETNGPGENFTKQVQLLRYGNLYREKHVPSAVDASDPGRVGWRSGPGAKRILLDDYRAALATGRFSNPSVAALDECLTYHQTGKGAVLSEREWTKEVNEDGARAPHGDRVIADALCWVACQHVGRQPIPVLPAGPHTIAAVLKKKAEERKRKERW